MSDTPDHNADATPRSQPDAQDALHIYQSHLDVLSNALMSDDFDTFVAYIRLPFRLATQKAVELIATRNDAREKFVQVRTALKSQGVTEYVRLAKSAKFVTPTEITGEHETHIIRVSHRLVRPYPSRLRLICDNGNWCETHAANGIESPEKFFADQDTNPTIPTTLSPSDAEKRSD